MSNFFLLCPINQHPLPYIMGSQRTCTEKQAATIETKVGLTLALLGRIAVGASQNNTKGSVFSVTVPY